MKTITVFLGLFLLLCLMFFCGCSVIQYSSSSQRKDPEPKILSSQQALKHLAQEKIFLKEVFLVFDLQNRPTVRWSGTDSVSGNVYSIDAFAQNIIKKPFKTASRILGKLYLGGKPYKIEEQKNNFILVPLP